MYEHIRLLRKERKHTYLSICFGSLKTKLRMVRLATAKFIFHRLDVFGNGFKKKGGTSKSKSH